eukprot:gene5147-8753_t
MSGQRERGKSIGKRLSTSLTGLFKVSKEEKVAIDITDDHFNSAHHNDDSDDDDTTQKQCDHEWRPYRKVFFMCTKCDKIREPTEEEKKKKGKK